MNIILPTSGTILMNENKLKKEKIGVVFQENTLDEELTIYENLMNLTDDPDVLAPLSYLRQREIVHHHRFKELYDEYVEKYYQPDMKKCQNN